MYVWVCLCMCVCVCVCVHVPDMSSDPGEEEAPTEGVFEGHQEAVNGLQIHKGLLYTCSGDRTVKAFDLVVGVPQGPYPGPH